MQRVFKRSGARRPVYRLSLLAGTALVGLSLAAPAQSQDATWLANPGSGNFNTDANWSPATVPTGIATFETSATTAITVSANTVVGGFTFNADAYTITIDPGSVLTFSGVGITNNSGQTQSIINGGTLVFGGTSTAGDATLVTAGGSTTDFSSSAGPGGAGRLSAGSIAGGTYDLGANELTVGGNDTSTTVNGTIRGVGGSLVKTGAGTLTLTSLDNSYSGGTTINQGSISISHNAQLGDVAGGLVFGGGGLIVTGNVASARTILLDTGGGTIDVNAGSSFFLSSAGTIIGTGGLTKLGDGTLAIQGNSGYSGDTLVQAGRLVGSSSTAFSANSNYTVAAGATLEISDVPGIIATVGSLSGAGNVEIGNGATLSTGSNAVTAIFSGKLSGNGSLTHDGPGIQVLTGAGSALGGDLTLCGCVTGQFIIRGGGLAVGGFIDIEAGTLVIEQGGTLTGADSFLVFGAARISGAGSAVTIANDTAVAGTLTVEQGGTLATGGMTTLAGTVLVTGAGSAVTTDILAVQSLGFPASLTIAAGGALTSTGGASIIGLAAPIAALVTGAGSTWTVGGGGLSIGPGALEATSVTIADGGALVLTSGDLQIDERGTLNIGNGGRAGTLTIAAGAILLDGRIVADFTDSATLPYDILANFAAGTLTKRGTGILTLTGTNTYTGGTTIEGGTLSVAADVNLGDVAGALTLNGGVLQVTGTAFTQTARPIVFGPNGGGFDIVDEANTFIVTQPFAGPGSLSKAGAGTLLLTNTHTYSGATTITGGIFQAGQAGSFSPNSAFTVGAGARLDLAGFNQTLGSLAGAGSVTLGVATLTAGRDGSSTTFSGAISGTGGLVKTGTGTLALTGVSTYRGPTTVTDGRLAVNGSIANSIVTLTGGTLAGNGTVGGINAQAGAVAPGNSIGTITVAGNVAFAAGSTYQVEVNPAGASDRIAATGTATLSGGTVQILAEQGAYSTATRYTILTAQGGVAGQFASVTSNLAFLTPSLSYEPNAVVLTLGRNAVAFASAAITRNQINLARAADTLPTDNAVFRALAASTLAEARAGFDLLSGEAHAQAVAVAIADSHVIRDTIINRLRGPLLTAPSGSVQAGYTADLPGRKTATALAAPSFNPNRFALWGEIIGTQGRTDGDGNAASLGHRGGGGLIGAEVNSAGAGDGQWKAGLAGGYTSRRFDLDARRSNGELDSVHAALYGGVRFGAVSLRAGAAYAWSDTDVKRQVALRGFGDLLRLDGRSSTAQIFGEIGYALPLGPAAFEPFIQVAAVSVHTEGASEQGGAAALRVAGRDQRLGFSTLGLRAEIPVAGLPLIARGMLGWRHAFGETTPAANLSLAGSATPFRVYAAPVARDALVAEAGLAWRVSASTTLGLSYNAAIAAKSHDQTLRGRLDITF